MRYRILLALLFCSFISNAENDRISFATHNIPDSLTEHAVAVVRYYDAAYEIRDLEEVFLVEKYAVTILNERGKSLASLVKYYNKKSTIRSISGTLYDENGRVITKIKNKDVADVVLLTDDVEDTRCKFYQFTRNKYPYTVEFVTERRLNSTFYIPSFSPMMGLGCSLERSNLVLTTPSKLPVRFHVLQFPYPKGEQSGETITYSLSSGAMKAKWKSDAFSPNEATALPQVLIATDTFVFYDGTGNMRDWASFGKFIYQLNENRDTLPSEAKAIVHQVSDSCNNPKSKIVALYHYLQNNTRYVSIQLGVGGFQTRDASLTYRKKYGDCKALSYFMNAMLKEVGINSFAVLVGAGADRNSYFHEQFPSQQFNHVILAVPQEKDTVWLECTSDFLPAGYLSEFTSDRKALLLSTNGGTVVNTPKYGWKMNRLSRNAIFKLGDDGKLIGELTSERMGIFWEERWIMIREQTKSERGNYLNEVFSKFNYKVLDFTISNQSDCDVPRLLEKISIGSNLAVSRTGSDLIVSTQLSPTPLPPVDRETGGDLGLQVFSSYTLTDTETILLDAEYVSATNDSTVTFQFPFGSYVAQWRVFGRSLVNTSTLTMKAGHYSPSEVQNYINFRKAVKRNSERKILLHKM